LEALLIVGTWLQDTVQITLITSYCLQVQLLRLSLNATVNQVLQRQISLETAMKVSLPNSHLPSFLVFYTNDRCHFYSSSVTNTSSRAPTFKQKEVAQSLAAKRN
jgi:hypothetical protein